MLDIYFFGDPGPYDQWHPQKVMTNDAKRVVFDITRNEKGHFKKADFDKVLIDDLLRMNLIKDDDGLSINFPIFLEEDLKYISRFSDVVGEKIGQVILDNRSSIHSMYKSIADAAGVSIERALYHLIGDRVFDGEALDYFSDKGLFSVSKNQPDGRDYIVIGYESSEMVDIYSRKLLCSSNNMKAKSMVFNSFGDADGDRNDLYRFFRKISVALDNSTERSNTNQAYVNISNRMNAVLVDELESLIRIHTSDPRHVYEESELDKLGLLEAMGYLTLVEGRVELKVPLFRKHLENLIDQNALSILKLIEADVEELFHELDGYLKETSSVKHKVDLLEIGNEVWHQVFGGICEYLIRKGFFEEPMYIAGEGRYLQSIYEK